MGAPNGTKGIYTHGSGHKLSMWYHVVLGHSAESLLVLITLRGRRFEPFARRQRIFLLRTGTTCAVATPRRTKAITHRMKSMREVRTTGRCHDTYYYTTGTTYYRYRIYYRYTVQLYE